MLPKAPPTLQVTFLYVEWGRALNYQLMKLTENQTSPWQFAEGFLNDLIEDVVMLPVCLLRHGVPV